MRAPDFWTSDRFSARGLAATLVPAAALYAIGARLSRNTKPPFRPKARVLCIGNLTVGGTGKTPIAIALAHRLVATGHRPVFLTRGYGGKLRGPVVVGTQPHRASDVGDEALLLAATAPVIVARDRPAGAALADEMNADIIVMDDGFQNFSIAKDLSLLVVDAKTGFGNGRLIPAGPLREPIADGLVRADGLIVMGNGKLLLPRFDGPVMRALLRPTAPEALTGKSVFAFAGIGRPEKFFETLRQSGARLGGTKGFADHHTFSRAELAALRAIAEKNGLLLVTTEKDYLRIEPGERHAIVPVPVHAVFADDAPLASLLDRLTKAED
ncbi:MAG: tetraacyldisaccharide 4'-kinase [Proteobacteria bacterium]|nr:tetraacyldisaccharide 4'-kinase [Pseudomonadota bacterium]